MVKTELINWKQFKDKLLQHPELDLQFQYAENTLVNAAYHITEIKQAPITAVDCGGVMNNWTEIIIQLYEPEGQNQLRSMKVKKALSIIELVEQTLPLDPNGTIKIEFGNPAFDTRQMLPNEIVIDAENLLIDLRPDAVQCKAIERGGNCGEPKTKLVNLAPTTDACCTPGGGCC